MIRVPEVSLKNTLLKGFDKLTSSKLGRRSKLKNELVHIKPFVFV